jgi:23S rRNA pseudouridine1911/1915/1917 synthase
MNTTYQETKKERLDKYLVDKYPNISRSQMQKLVKDGEILINKEKVLPHHFLRAGDEILIPENLVEMINVVEYKKPTANKKVKIDIVKETDDYLVVTKPAGVLVHPTSKNEADTLVNGLLAYFPKIKSVGDKKKGEINIRPGIVHRLDRDVSGVMVVAKTQEMFDYLKQQFKNREIKKVYVALVYGVMTDNSGIIDLPIGQSNKSGKMAARPKNSEFESKPAITKYEVIKRYQHYTLIKVEIKTGRTHQIRVHLNAVGYPVVGDETYKPRNQKTRIKLDRIFLHAEQLGFSDLGGAWQEFESPLPENLEEVHLGLAI